MEYAKRLKNYSKYIKNMWNCYKRTAKYFMSDPPIFRFTINLLEVNFYIERECIKGIKD